MEIISPVTAKRKAILIATSLAAVMIGFGLVSMPPDEPFAIFGKKFQMEIAVFLSLIAIVIAYQAVNYGWSLIDDISQCRTRAGGALQSIGTSLEALVRLLSAVERKAKLFRWPDSPEDADSFRKDEYVVENIDKIPPALAELKDMIGQVRKINFFEQASLKARLYIWEAAIPLGLAITAEFAVWRAVL